MTTKAKELLRVIEEAAATTTSTWRTKRGSDIRNFANLKRDLMVHDNKVMVEGTADEVTVTVQSMLDKELDYLMEKYGYEKA